MVIAEVKLPEKDAEMILKVILKVAKTKMINLLNTPKKINFLNFITLPITFGIGVDYAVNILGRFHEDKNSNADRSILSVVGNTGGAVMLCSSTTIIGYSSLLISGSQAFTSFGRLAVLGEFTCIFAAIIALPAFWLLLQRFSRSKQTSA
jgi:predicted RND superfamily exporter protein